MKEEILRLDKVTYIANGVTLLDNFNLYIFKGEIMGLVYINSHGQESFVELVCQNLPLHYGTVYFDERPVNHYAGSTAASNRVAVIERRSRLVENLTVADNVFVLKKDFRKVIINGELLSRSFEGFIKGLDIALDIHGDDLILNLTPFQKCVVEVLKAVAMGIKLVIISNISNFVSVTDLKEFHSILTRFAKRGMSFIYICNHHEETFRICHKISIIENGKILKILDKSSFKDENIAPYTLDFYNKGISSDNRLTENIVLQLNQVSTKGIRPMSLAIKKGECVVFLDMNNNALDELFELLSGGISPVSGEILLEGKLTTSAVRKRQIKVIQENPTETMLFRNISYFDNLCFLLRDKYFVMPINRRLRKSVTQEYKELIGDEINCGDIGRLKPASLYSLVYYRVHLYNPKIAICIQPFSEADMYLRYHILSLMKRLIAKGVTVIILAVSISDTLFVGDRLLIINNGELTQEVDRTGFMYLNQNK